MWTEDTTCHKAFCCLGSSRRYRPTYGDIDWGSSWPYGTAASYCTISCVLPETQSGEAIRDGHKRDSWAYLFDVSTGYLVAKDHYMIELPIELRLYAA